MKKHSHIWLVGFAFVILLCSTLWLTNSDNVKNINNNKFLAPVTIFKTGEIKSVYQVWWDFNSTEGVLPYVVWIGNENLTVYYADELSLYIGCNVTLHLTVHSYSKYRYVGFFMNSCGDE